MTVCTGVGKQLQVCRYAQVWGNICMCPGMHRCGETVGSLGSLYKGGVKTTLGTLVYRFERQIARKKILPSKNTVSLT